MKRPSKTDAFFEHRKIACQWYAEMAGNFGVPRASGPYRSNDTFRDAIDHRNNLYSYDATKATLLLFGTERPYYEVVSGPFRKGAEFAFLCNQEGRGKLLVITDYKEL